MSFSDHLEREDAIRRNVNWRERVESVNCHDLQSAAGPMRRALRDARLERVLEHPVGVSREVECDRALLRDKEEASYLLELGLVCKDAEVARSVDPFDRGLLFWRPAPVFANTDRSRLSSIATADQRRVE